MKPIVMLTLSFLCLDVGLCSATDTIDKASEFKIFSKSLNEERTIVVSLPDGYDQGDTRYPVLYMLDGVQNLWHIIGSCELLTRTGNMPPAIIVGIKSGNRTLDFTPTKVGTKSSGGAAEFLKFIRDECIPYIETRYRTHPFRVLEGHSLSGLFTAYTLMEEPSLFDAYVIMSPAFWWDEEWIIERAKGYFKATASLDKAIYFGIGMDDGQGMRQELIRFTEAIGKPWPEKLRWLHKEFEDEGHMSATLLTNYHALKFIFSDMKFPDEIHETYSDATFTSHENNIMKKYGAAARQSQENYVPLGLKLMGEKNYQGAITVFERNLQAYVSNNWPQNNVWLAEAYDKAGNLKEALAQYQEAYRLSAKTNYGDPEKYQARIEQLTKELVQNDSNARDKE